MPLSLESWWWGAASYTACHLTHLAWWHVRRPKRDLASLAALFFVVPLPLTAATVGMPASLIHFWLSAQYLAVYPAFQASSPTLHMVAALSRRREGIAESSLLSLSAALDREQERTQSLSAAGLMMNERTLTTAGRWLAKVFLLYRNWLGLSEGEG